jgi:hypothetical protein
MEDSTLLDLRNVTVREAILADPIGTTTVSMDGGWHRQNALSFLLLAANPINST